jgi:hypothetical protein
MECAILADAGAVVDEFGGGGNFLVHRSVALVGLIGAIDARREFQFEAAAARAVGELDDAAATRVLRAIAAAGYGAHPARVVRRAAMNGLPLAIEQMLETGSRVEGDDAVGTLESVARSARCGVGTLEAVYGGMMRAERAAAARAEAAVASLGALGEGWGADVGADVLGASRVLRAKLEALVVRRRKRVCDMGRLQGSDVFVIVAREAAKLGGDVVAAANDWTKNEWTKNEWTKKLEFLISVGAHEGKLTAGHVGESYFGSVLVSERLWRAVEGAVMMAYVGKWCEGARRSAARRGVTVGRGAAALAGVVGQLTGGAGGIEAVDPTLMRLGEAEGIATGAGACREIMSLLWTQLSSSSSLFLGRNATSAYGLVPAPDAPEGSLIVLGWLLARAAVGNFTLGAPGVSVPVLGWMLGADATGSDMGGLSESMLCGGDGWGTHTVSVGDALGYVFGTAPWLDVDAGAVCELVGGSEVGGSTVGRFGESVAGIVRQMLKRATDLMAVGFDAGLCGTNKAHGRVARSLVLSGVVCGRVSAGLRFNGPVAIDVGAWESSTVYPAGCGYTAGHGTVRLFWRVVGEELTAAERLRLYKFWTGDASPAAAGPTGMEFKIYRQGLPRGRRVLPIAPTVQTCFLALHLAPYRERERAQLATALRVCIAHADVMLSV